MAIVELRSYDGNGLVEVEIKGPRSAIAYFCSECVGWSMSPTECPDYNCPLRNFRPLGLRKPGLRRNASKNTQGRIKPPTNKTVG